MSVGKKRMRLVRKTSFCFFLPKKNSKEKGRYFTTNRLFKTEQRATHHQKPPPKTGTDDFPNDERASSTRGFFRPLSRRGTTSARATTLFVVSCLFLVGEIFQLWIGTRVASSRKKKISGERRRDGQRSSHASTREGALRFPVFLRFVVGSHRKGRSPVPRIRPPRDFFEMPCENVLCNQTVPPNGIQKRRDGFTTNLRDARFLRSSESSSTRRARTTWTSTITFFPSLTITFGRV